MRRLPMHSTMAVAMILVWTSACVNIRSEKKTQALNIATNPVGAEVYVRDEAGQRIIGSSPVTFDREYVEETKDFNGAWWTTLVVSLGVLAGGVVLLALGSTADGPIDDAIGKGAGSSMIFAGGIGTILSGIFCGLASAKEGQSEVIAAPTYVGARMNGYHQNEIQVPSPGGKKDLSLILKPSGGEAPAVAAPVRTNPAREIVAVFDIQDSTGKLDKQTLVQLTTYLLTRMTQTGIYKTIPRDQLRARLLEQKTGSYQQCFDESCQIQLGKALAAQKSLATSLIQVGDRCAATANLYDLKTETVEKGASVKTGCTTNELLEAMEKIATQLAAR